MLGALYGDIIGSKYEFNNFRTKNIVLFDDRSVVTDDSIMTLAVLEILQKNYQNDKDKIIDTFKKWGRAYPNMGYGIRFSSWLFSDNRDSYRSYGNGAAMRVSPVGWYARDEQEVKELAKVVTEVTHSHLEGLKGAEVVAMCVYYARKGKSKEFIKSYVEQYYNLDFDYEELKKNYYFNETCQETVPQAIFCFLISNSLEDCVRTSISIGGDSDTVACIACSIADAFYKEMNYATIDEILNRLPEDKDGCHPKDVLLNGLKHKYMESIYDEDITDDTKFILEITHGVKYESCYCYYSKSLQLLTRELISYSIESTYPNNDWEQMEEKIFTKKDLQLFIDILEYYFQFREYNSLNKIKLQLFEIMDNKNPSLLKEFLNLYNQELNDYSEGVKYIYCDNKNEALNYIVNNYGNDNETIKDVFNSVHKKIVNT